MRSCNYYYKFCYLFAILTTFSFQFILYFTLVLPPYYYFKLLWLYLQYRLLVWFYFVYYFAIILCFCLQHCVPPSMKSARKTSNKEVNNFRVIKNMAICIRNSNHRHMTHFINDFLFRQTINIPFINFISRNRKLGLKRSFFKLQGWDPTFLRK